MNSNLVFPGIITVFWPRLVPISCSTPYRVAVPYQLVAPHRQDRSVPTLTLLAYQVSVAGGVFRRLVMPRYCCE
jgi:hypothetical protein